MESTKLGASIGQISPGGQCGGSSMGLVCRCCCLGTGTDSGILTIHHPSSHLNIPMSSKERQRSSYLKNKNKKEDDLMWKIILSVEILQGQRTTSSITEVQPRDRHLERTTQSPAYCGEGLSIHLAFPSQFSPRAHPRPPRQAGGNHIVHNEATGLSVCR